MTLDRQVRALLAAAVALIAVCLMASAAEAHPGHHHAPLIVEATALVAPACPLKGAAAAPDTSARIAESATAQSAIAENPSAAASPHTPAQPEACCTTCMACCAHAHALAPEPGGVIPRSRGVRLVRPPDALAHPGADGEALPEPPRPFA